jgi:hypothetical protein
VLFCPHLRLKKENVLTADNKGLTLSDADEKKRNMKNSDANRFGIRLDRAYAIA